MATESHKSLYLQSMGFIEVRRLTMQEVAVLWRNAQRTACGNQDALKWVLLMGGLSLGISKPKMTRSDIESFIKKHAKEAAHVAEAIISLTTRE